MFPTDRDQILWDRLNRHPQMRTRVESLLAVVEDAEKVTVNKPMTAAGEPRVIIASARSVLRWKPRRAWGMPAAWQRAGSINRRLSA